MRKFYEIYEFYYVPFWKASYFIIIVSVIAAILLLFIVYKLISIFRKKNEKVLSLSEKTEIEIRALDPVKLSSKKEFKQFYFNLSCILKRYLSKQYNFKLEDKTDTEIEECLSDEMWLRDLIEILDGSSFVKFADEDAIPGKAKKDWEKALDIISYTKPLDT